MRPPVSTCDLITVGPPIRAAIARASSALVAKPKSVTGIPARLTIWRDSYSKKRIGGGAERIEARLTVGLLSVVDGRPSVLQVAQPNDGGVAQHVLDLSLGLHERGWRVEV